MSKRVRANKEYKDDSRRLEVVTDEVACKQETESRRLEFAAEEVACTHEMMLGKWKAKYQMLHNIDKNKENWTSKCISRK